MTPHRIELARLALSYLQALTTGPVIAGGIVIAVLFMFKNDVRELIEAIIEIKFPGGALSMSQRRRDRQVAAEAKAGGEPLPPPSPASGGAAMTALNNEKLLWEYRYLNHYLVPMTQFVLDWLANTTSPITVSFFDSWWLPVIPSAQERSAILNALETHHLVYIDRSSWLVTVTPKGREYLNFRGPMPRPVPEAVSHEPKVSAAPNATPDGTVVT